MLYVSLPHAIVPYEHSFPKIWADRYFLLNLDTEDNDLMCEYRPLESGI